ncbi:hypothetical protein BDA96_08G017200 [Sorghum bicolor]|uniref:Major facilitator superfamily (MFS) profile domain-containing protein n=1 Tax=Sorghum bicolor TaxID=4558 RepID=A0A921U5R2_SORBI|nr:hypothetical protein BDA96_08G017200 [Sorghum bicolor]
MGEAALVRCDELVRVEDYICLWLPMEESSSSSPLLEKKYHPGCPGCAYDQKKDLQEGIPYKEFLYVWIICLCAALPVSSLFPFLYFMIRDLHVAKRTEDIGFYAGFVGASFMLGRCLTSTAWGIAADRIGRKPVVMVGILSVVIFNTLFGLSASYWMAIATRFLLGALNGLLGPIKAYAIEICRPEHEALGLSLVSTAWGIGLIIGPALGGYLALPAEKFPTSFHQTHSLEGSRISYPACAHHSLLLLFLQAAYGCRFI